MVLIPLELDLSYPVLPLAEMPALGTVAPLPAAAEKNGPGHGLHFDFILLMDCDVTTAVMCYVIIFPCLLLSFGSNSILSGQLVGDGFFRSSLLDLP